MNIVAFQKSFVSTNSSKQIPCFILENVILIQRNLNLLQDSDSIILTDNQGFIYSRNIQKEFDTNENSFYIYERL